MNVYDYKDLRVGQTASFKKVLTENMLNAFCNLSGDTNPLHCDVNFAQSKGYPGKVVYGMLSASLYSRLAGVYLPGRNCLLQSVHADFLRPVFVGDELTVIGKIFEKNDSVHQIVIKAVLCNQHGEKVSKAKIEAGVI